LAARTLLRATGPGDCLGYASRDPLTGELEVVYAVRGPEADSLLEMLGEKHRRGWRRRLIESVLPRPRADEPY